MEHEFFPYSTVQSGHIINVKSILRRDGPILNIDYVFSGDLSPLIFPEKAVNPARIDGLWDHTCMECFISLDKSESYWEFNKSPSGDWSVYKFNSYRSDCIHEQNIFIQSSSSTINENIRIEHIAIHLPSLCINGCTEYSYDVGLAVVIEHIDGNLTYWAPIHCGTRPDFHLRQSFFIQL
eukprot:gene9059-18768_t